MRRDHGFSGTEFLVVLSLIAIVASFIIYSGARVRREQALSRSAEKLAEDIRRAQGYALASREFRPGEVPCGYGIAVSAASRTYRLFADRDLKNINCSARDFVRAADGSEDVETIPLEPAIEIAAVSAESIVFTPPDPITAITPATSTLSVTLQNLASSSIKVVRARTSGEVVIE
ncbi:type II secretion system protein [Candidatus Azambacteria bacterium]|nr:type II secretion system protein [Candidatus Azambacteria bacterium]